MMISKSYKNKRGENVLLSPHNPILDYDASNLIFPLSQSFLCFTKKLSVIIVLF